MPKDANKGKGEGKAKPGKSNGKVKGKENLREGSLGWEDVDDGDLEAHAAYVETTSFNIYKVTYGCRLGRYLMILLMMRWLCWMMNGRV